MDRQLVTTTEEKAAPPERILLTPRFTPARTGDGFQVQGLWSDVASVVRSACFSPFLAMDWETKGNDPSDPSLEIVGLGLAWDQGSIYFDWTALYGHQKKELFDLLLTHQGLLAHNVYFDGGVLFAKTGQHPQWAACTLALYMMLSNEGWVGQQWGLKTAQTDILLWTETNERDLDHWLVMNGWYKGTPVKDPTPELMEERFQSGSLRPEKAEMWRAPADILGKYCVLDAESCYLLYMEHLAPVLEQFPEFKEFYSTEFMQLILLHIEQKMHGLLMDIPALHQRKEELVHDLSHRNQQLLAHPLLETPIREIESTLLSELVAKAPPRLLKQKARPKEPPQWTKDGAISKNWERWVQNGPKYTVPVVSKVWEAWHERYKLAVSGQDPAYRFNIQSPDHLRHVLYTSLGYPVRIETDSGLPGTGVKALKHMGDIGQALVERSWVEKEMGFIDDYLERTQGRETIHPSFRLPGTKTGRLSSKSPNLQQVPKTKAMMSLFIARPGHLLVDLDFSALEPVVTTEFSQDENMEKIYGNGRPANDIYLFIAASIPGYREKVKAVGYDPYLPTKEGLARAKKECKAERTVCKTVALACAYGAGVDKVMSTLENDDVFLSREEVEKVHSGYWELFRGVKQFGYDLQRQWKRNGGYVLNGLGRPMCLTEDYKHDVLNRFIQSTGHDILVKYISILTGILRGHEVPFQPWVIDWHDAAAVEIPEQFLEKTVQCYHLAMWELNRQLGGRIELKGTPSWGKTMADIKEPEE